MSTNVSPKLIKNTLLLINSLVFIAGIYIFIDGVIQLIDLRTNEIVHNIEEESESIEVINNTLSTNFSDLIEDRFPSVGAPSVVLIFGIINILLSILAITAINKEDVRLLTSYRITLVMTLIIRIVFFLATLCMYAFDIDYKPIRVTTAISAIIAIIELILVFCVYRFVKLLKRGVHQ